MTKIDRLREYLSTLRPPIAVACSGGVDSTFLVKIALDVHGKQWVYPVFMDSVFVTEADRSWIEAVSRNLGVQVLRYKWNPLSYLEIRSNTRRRCYWCKLHMYSIIKEKVKTFGVSQILDGTQGDDLNRDRPGIFAIKKLNILTPMADLFLTKDEIRFESNKYSLAPANRPSESCLATKIDFGIVITKNQLKQIENGLIN
ncbi:ATP-utilizing enzyme of the PP-loop superfamily [Dissulfuribacter thermophilus]|uniref:ATP-utilizing enzyme of the PP-loop superfamily n=1 Tax=Dissulfuribacter thermophilus TaxID=1156395 RepID=A0A1B9F5S0_9BACT|nr:hypothetical protein [Dissulfuribacter thermophilus]OCC15262.1 ATP-utilizing enzyme of the PP-loop superfamily [Dissulfuribacter thermophilus]